MAETKVIMPQMGESIFEGTLTKWLKKKGDRVQRDEPLFEISTDKIDSEIPAPASGVLQDVLVKEGQTVQINTVVAVIGDGARKPAAEGAPAKEAAPKEPPKPPQKKEEPKEMKGAAPVAGATAEAEAEEEEAGQNGNIRSSPLVRRIAKENNVDLSALAGKGTGINGRITKSDILSYIEQGGKRATTPTQARPPAVQAPPPPAMKFTGDVERVPLSDRKSVV